MARCLVCDSEYEVDAGHSQVDCRGARVDISIAKQLQQSVERNSRMVGRLQVLPARLRAQVIPELIDAADDILDISKDKDPF